MLEKSRIIKVNVEIFHYVDKLPVKDITKECKKGIKKLLNTQKNKIINHRELEDEKFPNEAFEDKQAKKFEIDVTIRELNMGKKRDKYEIYVSLN